jgi:hypothetical protein
MTVTTYDLLEISHVLGVLENHTKYASGPNGPMLVDGQATTLRQGHELDEMNDDLAAPPEPTREELDYHCEQEVLRARDCPEDKGTGGTEVTELTEDDDTEATESAPLRRSERSTNRPSKYVAAQLKE